MDFKTGISKALAAAILSTGLLWPKPGFAQMLPLSASEQLVCEDLDFCVDLMLRHAPDEFDYAVLAQEFKRMGPKGTERLLGYVGGNSDKAVKRAQLILSQPGWNFNPAQQRAVAKLWPVGDIERHADIMHKIGSPMMRNRAVETLIDDDPNIRTASRAILTSVDLKSKFRLPPQAFGTLVRALVDDPTPEIITLIGTFPASQSGPILRRTLLSGDAKSVMAAYEALYEFDAKAAFMSLTDALKKIENPDQAFAISVMLRERHLGRDDGFYLKFASDLAIDDSFPMLARMVGVDAIMGQGERNPVSLPDDPKAAQAFAFTVKQMGVDFDAYSQELQTKTGKQTAKYLTLIWPQLVPPFDEAKAQYAQLAGRLNDPAMLGILQEALRDKTDWRVTREAVMALGRRKDKASIPAITKISQTHPIRHVRVAAGAALEWMQTDTLNLKKWETRLAQRQDYCKVNSTNFREDAEQMPYFDNGKFATGAPAIRTRLVSAAPSKRGWLAGYDSGLLYYDNQSGQSKVLLDRSVLAVVPTLKPKLGSQASTFWAVTHSKNSKGSSQLYRIDMTQQPPRIARHAQLPDVIAAIYAAGDHTLQIGFGETLKNHPPLRLLPNGGIISGCVKPKSTGAMNALPN